MKAYGQDEWKIPQCSQGQPGTCDPPCLCLQSAGTTGRYEHSRPTLIFKEISLLGEKKSYVEDGNQMSTMEPLHCLPTATNMAAITHSLL